MGQRRCGGSPFAGGGAAILIILAALIVPIHGFLDDKLPLEVVATTPPELVQEITDPEGVWFSDGSEATITVVFSRAVIALGSDFGEEELPDDLVPFKISDSELAPGRFRWVTTSIARFDPIRSWAPDLDLTLAWNRNMTTYDGVPLNLTLADVRIRTGSVQMRLQGVASEKANELTDNHWDAEVGLEDDNLPEVPDDSYLVLGFSFPVMLDVLQKNLELYKVTFTEQEKENGEEKGGKEKAREKTDIKLKVRQCWNLNETLFDSEGDPIEGTCAVVSLQNAKLEKETRYELVLPEGSQYSLKAGKLREELFFEFYGLRRFRIPIEDDTYSFRNVNSRAEVGKYPNDWGFVSGRRLIMWLPHGLANGTDLDTLSSAFTFERITFKDERKINKRPFELSLENKGTLMFKAKLEPAQKYRLTIEARDDVRDGFGLPLVANEMVFVTSRPADRILSFHDSSNVLVERSLSWNGTYPLMSFGYFFDMIKSFSVWVVDPKTEEDMAIWGYRIAQNQEINKTIEPPDAEVQLSSTNVYFPKFKDMELRDLLDESGLLYYHRSAPEQHGGEFEGFINEMDLQVGMFDVSIDNETVVTLFVTSISNGKPIQGASVNVMRRQDKDYDELGYDEEDRLEFLETVETNEDGIAEFNRRSCKNTFRCNDYIMMIEHKKKLTLAKTTVQTPVSVSPTVVGTLVLDRKLIQPGEKVKISGFFTGRRGKQLSVSDFDTVTISVPGIGDGFKVPFNSKYGTFTATFKVPEDAISDTYTVEAQLGNDHEASEAFVVGEPRIPTAVLTLTTPPWAKLGSTVNVEIQAASLIGPAVAGAPMTLSWTVYSVDGEEKADVTETVVTNVTGGVTVPIDLTSLKVPAAEGDTLHISVVWIGPTRERIEETAELRIQKSAYALSIERSLFTDIPDVRFGLWATATEQLPDETVKADGLRVDVKLYKAPSDLEGDSDTIEKLRNPKSKAVKLKFVKGCLIKTGDLMSADKCRLFMPSVGRYVVRACIRDGRTQICEVDIFGRNSTSWENQPLSMEDVSLNFKAKSDIEGNFEVDPATQKAKVLVDVPFSNTQLYVVWGNDVAIKKKRFSFTFNGIQEVELEMGDSCLFGCSAQFYMAVPRQKISFAKDLPRRMDIDPSAPRILTGKLEMSYRNQTFPYYMNVTMGIKVGDEDPVFNSADPDAEYIPPVIAPGEKATILVNVDKCAGNPVDPSSIACTSTENAENAEVVVIAVDKAFLLMVENPLKDLTAELELTEFADLIGLGIWPGADDQWMDPDSLQLLKQVLIRRFDIDPWTMDRTLSYGGTIDGSDFSRPDKEILKELVTSITKGPPGLSGIWGLLGRQLNQPSAQTGPSARSPVDAADPKLRLAADFKPTPLFKVIKTKADGSGNAEFTAPPNLGTFVVRAYATSDSFQHGVSETELIVRLPLSLTSSAPRIVRVGDKFEAGVIITVAGGEVEDVPVTVTLLSDPDRAGDIEYIPDPAQRRSLLQEEDCEGVSCMVTLDQKTIKTDVDGQVEVRFKFSAERIGGGNLTIRADARGANDALQVALPVLGQQDEIQLATSFAVKAEESGSSWQEGLKLPEAVNGSGTIDLAAGVGRFPAVLEHAKAIMNFWTEEPFADDAVANATVVAILQQYGADDSVNDQEDLFDNATRAFQFALWNLNKGNLTRSKVGLTWFKDVNEIVKDANVWLNSMGIWMIEQTLDKLDTTDDKVFEDGAELLKKVTKVWKNAVKRQVVKDATKARKKGFKISLYDVLNARFALGPNWEPKSNNTLVIKDLSMERVSKAFKSFSVGNQAKIALMWIAELGKEKGKDHPDVKAALKTFQSNFRAIGRTAYLSVDADSSSPADELDQALALLTFVRTDEQDSNPLIEKLVNHIGSSGRFSSPFRRFAKMLALTEYDFSTGSTDPDMTLKVKSGDVELLEAEFTSPSDPVVTTSTPFDDLASPPDPLMFLVEGKKGEASLVATLKFIPAELLPFPTYRGIFVERIIQVSDANGWATGSPLKTVPLGKSIVITLQITSPDQLGPVTVEALMPGGLEPVDPNVASEADTRATCALGRLDLDFARFYIWPVCPEQETYTEMVRFRYYGLPSGTSEIQFQAVAASVGDWILPPVKAFAAEQPEVMGLSPAGSFKICDSTLKSCKAEAAEAAEPVKECPNDCSGAGQCDLSKGTCICEEGFVGEDCSDLAQS